MLPAIASRDRHALLVGWASSSLPWALLCPLRSLRLKTRLPRERRYRSSLTTSCQMSRAIACVLSWSSTHPVPDHLHIVTEVSLHLFARARGSDTQQSE